MTRRAIIGALAVLMGFGATGAQAADTITVMAYNIWGGGANEGKPVDETVAVIKAAGADIVSISETRMEGARAAALKVLSAAVVGEKKPEADIVVTPWPSDHRAAVTKVEF